MNEIKLLVRDSNNNKVGELDGYTEFHAISRYNAIGSWTLDMDYSLDQAALIDRYAGIAVMLDGAVVFSGPITGIRRQDIAMKDTIMLFGQDDLEKIAGRLVLPDPTGPPYTAYAYDVRTGAAETIIKQYVNYNCGPLAKVSRRVAGLTIAADVGRGGSAVGRGRFDKMVEFLTSLATIGAVGFQCRDMVFDCYVPTDRSASIILSKTSGTLEEFIYEISAPDMNYSIVGGLGDLTARAFAEAGDSQSIMDWGLREDFLDYNTTAVIAELLDRATDELTQRAGATKLDITSQSLPGREPITDYWLGDTVTAVIDDVPLQVKAVEFEIILDGSGIQKVVPTFSNGNSPVGLLHNFDREARTRRAVNRMERK